MDESHLIGVDKRGDKAESAIIRFTKQNPNCRIVFLSATMPNVSELAKWLTMLNGKKTELINSNYRPCDLDVHYVQYNNRGKYAIKESNKIREAVKITQEYLDDKFIVFVHSKATGRKIYNYLKELGENVEIHNAELGLKDRLNVERSFKSRECGSLRIIVATSTLAWGCNLPARRVIVVGVHRGLNEVEPLDIKQEIGRSGRVGLDPKGDAYILLPDTDFDYYKKWCVNIPPITSTMNNADVLAFHIVSEISENQIYDVETLMDWYNRSLAAFQNDFIDRVDSEELLEKLEKINIIEKKDERYKITKLGQVAAHLYFSPFSIAGWYMNFSRIFRDSKDIPNDNQISWALANITENNKNFVPKDYKDGVESYKTQCKLNGLSINDGVAWVGYCNNACLKFIDIDPAQKRNVQFDIERTITALEMIDTRYAQWDKGDFFKKLQLRIQYEVSWEQTVLCSLKGIGGVYARKLFDAGITKISQLKNNPEACVSVIGQKKYSSILSDNNI